MSTRTEKERTKQIHDKCQRLLNEMLKDDDNKYCVDCDAKGPRWASWNIGIFLCIRCAGIHRKLGVHISRVKSVNLDTWTPQQVVSLQQMGNSRARAVYEANLPDNFRRPQSDGSLETFIRAKYEHKKYIAREWVPPPLPKVNWDKELEEEAEKQKKKKREGIQSNLSSSIRPITAPPVIPQPLPKPQTSSPKPNRSSAQQNTTTDLLGLSTPTKESNHKHSSDSDLFTNFLDASSEPISNISTDSINNTPSSATSISRSEEEENFFSQSMSSTPSKQQQLTKDSILALYGNPSRNLGAAPMGVVGSNVFGASPLNGSINSFPRQPAMPQPPTLQNDLMQAGVPFSNNVTSSGANAAFASNPFYSLAASGVQSGFSGLKGFSNFAPTTNSSMVELDLPAQFSQQMDGLNLNGKPNQFSFPQTSAFEVNNDSAKKPPQPANASFGQSVSATPFWE